MSELRGDTVFDGDIAIAKCEAVNGRFVLTPIDGDCGWKKHMGEAPDAGYIAELFACSVCGGCASLHYMEPTRTRLLADKVCFTCDHWLQLIRSDTKADSAHVIVDGRHYMLGKNMQRDGDDRAGFGGAVYNIEFNDGRKARCNNLWSQGTIPDRFREQLPDNARFVSAK